MTHEELIERGFEAYEGGDVLCIGGVEIGVYLPDLSVSVGEKEPGHVVDVPNCNTIHDVDHLIRLFTKEK
jgi:hypothetical protein